MGVTLKNGTHLVTSAEGVQMPRFVFNIISPDRVVTDHTGTEVAGL